METRASRKILLAVLFAIIGQFCFAQSKVPSTPEEKRAAFLTPEYYTNWLGASFFTIPTVEKEFDVTPTKILDLTFFYDFGDCLVGMESNEKGVVVQMTIRLFADQATDFIQKAVDYGYEYVAKRQKCKRALKHWQTTSRCLRYKRKTVSKDHKERKRLFGSFHKWQVRQ